MPQTLHSNLTAADIMDVRLWRSKHGQGAPHSTTPANLDIPYLVVSASDGSLYLHARGRAIVGGLAPHVMCALLWAERLSPGYVDEIASPTLTIEEALKTPQERQAARRAVETRAAAAKAAREAEDERRRASQRGPEDHSTLTLADLF